MNLLRLTQNFEQFRSPILYLLTITILFHFLKDTFITYYVLLSICFLLAFFFLFSRNFYKELFNFELIKIFFILYILSLLISTVTSILYMERWNMNTIDLVIALGRLYLCPLFCISVYILVHSKENLKYLLSIYYIFILIAVLSVLIQEIYGHMSFFGESHYWKERYGKVGYSSITGSVNSYGICFPVAILAIFFLSKFNVLIKSILIALILLTAISISSKAGFINICLTMLVVFYYSIQQKKMNVILLSFFLIFIGILSIDSLFLTFFGLFANITGIEVIQGTLGIGDITKGENFQKEYYSFSQLIYERISFRWWPDSLSHLDYIIGLGVYAGSGALGINSGTTHNGYLDMYLVGGIPLILSLFLLIIVVQIILFKKLFLFSNKIILILFWSNNIFLFNMIFYNGGFFHPVISFPFWISIAYLSSRVSKELTPS